MTAERHERERVADSSLSPIEDGLRALAAVFPGTVVEGTVDWDRLREVLGVEVEAPPRYIFRWAGRDDAVRAAQTASIATLDPLISHSVNWESTANVFVEGESLEVLKLLYKAYFGRIRLVYIDPPYNLGGDRIYQDDYSDPLGTYLATVTNQLDAEGDALTSNPETSGRYHGAWLSMLYPRLAIARQLLRDDGFIVASIDDVELYHLRMLMNEAFGEENYIATLVWDRNRKNDAKFFSVGHEYMVVYAKDAQYLRDSGVILRAPKEGVDEVRQLWDELRQEHGDDFEAIRDSLLSYYSGIPDDDPRRPLARFRKVDARGPYRDDVDISWPGGGGPSYEVLHPSTKRPCKLPERGWVYPTKERMEEEIEKDNVAFGPDETTVPARKSYLFEKAVQVMRSVNYSYAQTAAQTFADIFDGARVFDNPKYFEDMRQIVEYLTDEEDIVLDFFAGSGSTGHGVFQSNRQVGTRRTFILIQLQEPVNTGVESGRNAKRQGLEAISDIGEERLRRVLADLQATAEASAEGEVSEDLGFRIFRLAESHLKPWPTEELDEENLTLFVDRLRPGWTEDEVLWELALREGVPLSASIEFSEVAGNKVYTVRDRLSGRTLHVCLDDTVGSSIAREALLTPSDVLVCRDVALTDEVAANLALECHLKTV